MNIGEPVRTVIVKPATIPVPERFVDRPETERQPVQTPQEVPADKE